MEAAHFLPRVKNLTWGIKGVGAQGDGSVQMLARGREEQTELTRVLQEMGETKFLLFSTSSSVSCDGGTYVGAVKRKNSTCVPFVYRGWCAPGDGGLSIYVDNISIQPDPPPPVMYLVHTIWVWRASPPPPLHKQTARCCPTVAVRAVPRLFFYIPGIFFRVFVFCGMCFCFDRDVLRTSRDGDTIRGRPAGLAPPPHYLHRRCGRSRHPGSRATRVFGRGGRHFGVRRGG